MSTPSPSMSRRHAQAARAETWDRMRAHLSRLELRVLDELRVHGPCTTRALSGRSGIGLLSVRPRVCDLCAAHLADCVGREGGEGVYRARSDAEIARDISARVHRMRQDAVEQLMLDL